MIAIKRVAVTGAGGFIGSAVCRVFASLGCEVRGLVAPVGEATVSPPGLALDLRAAIGDRAALAHLLEGGVEVVVHLAGPPSVGASFADPIGYVQAHTSGTTAVLEACRASGAALVYISSAEVYGRPLSDPVTESHPYDARSPYAAAKIGAEQMVRAFDHAYGTASTIIRPFSVYGPGMGAHALVPAILRQFGGAGPLRLADFRPERDYCHIDDVARAIVAAALVKPKSTLAINIGSGLGTSVRDLACSALRLAGLDWEIEEGGAARRPGNADILRLVACRRRALDELAWEPLIPLEVGLRRMIDEARGREVQCGIS